MYAKFYGLLQEPFSIAPDPRYLYMSERHREALAHLLYGVKGGGGFVLLTGEVGAGKTTVCRCFLEQIPKRCNVAYIFNPKLTVRELLRSICEEFRVPLGTLNPATATIKDYVDPLNTFLLRTHALGMNNLLIIDEAQAVSADVLEQLRLLTNLETSERKLLQIILIGQPELRKLLARPDLEQVSQRVIARYHLKALTEEETDRYIRHRLAVAGMTRPTPFDRDALKRIHALTRGVPRRINLLCDRAMLGAYAAGQERIGKAIIDKAAQEVFEKPSGPAPATGRGAGPEGSHRRWIALGALGGVAAGLLAAGVVLWSLSARPDWTPPWASPGNPDAATAPSPGPGLTTPDDSATAAPAASAGAASAAASAAPTASGVAASLPDGRADDGRREADSGPLLTGLPGTMLDEAGAWRQLAQLWQLGTLEGDPCAALQRRQVHCYRGGGQRNLALLRKLDRPAMLVLQEPSGQGVGHVLLTGLGAQGAVLQVGEQRYAVPLDVLASRWRGDFALLWLPPPGFAPDSPDIGNDGDAARWVKARLDTLSDPSQGGPAASGGDNGPQALRERVQRFQRSQGLVADGLAGPITLMQLNRVTGVDEPHLAHDR